MSDMSYMGRLREVTLTEREIFRVTRSEYDLVSKMCDSSNMSRSDVWRSLLNTVAVMFDPDLKIGDAIRPDVARSMRITRKTANKKFSTMLRSLTEIQHIEDRRFIDSVSRDSRKIKSSGH